MKTVIMPYGRCFSIQIPVEIIERSLILLCWKKIIRAVYEFTGLVTQSLSKSGTEVTIVKSTTVSLARLDDYLATVVTCFRGDGTDKAGGLRQNLYHDTT